MVGEPVGKRDSGDNEGGRREGDMVSRREGEVEGMAAIEGKLVGPDDGSAVNDMTGLVVGAL